MSALELQQQIKILRDALEAAKNHLEYCGYGDRWERECASEEGLPQKIEQALQITEPNIVAAMQAPSPTPSNHASRRRAARAVTKASPTPAPLA